jgi:hypothetical protein
MKKNVVIYHIKNEKNQLIEKRYFFDTVQEACNFFQSIKSISVTKPIITDNYEYK